MNREISSKINEIKRHMPFPSSPLGNSLNKSLRLQHSNYNYDSFPVENFEEARR